MVRWLTAGESHGPALTGIVEGLPAGIPVTTQDVQDALARRRLGYGRGARMKFEQDAVTILGGVRHAKTLGSPVAIEVGNTEWPKWETVMSADAIDESDLDGQARNAPLTRPRATTMVSSWILPVARTRATMAATKSRTPASNTAATSW